MPTRRCLLPLAFAALAVAACTHPDAAPTRDAAGSMPSGAPSASPPPNPTASPEGDRLKPVYGADAGPADPLAVRLCDALDLTAARRIRECCASPPSLTATAITGQCVRTLSAALGSHAIALEEADVSRCAEAMARATTGCDWVGSGAESDPLPAECTGILHGRLPEKAKCRSSIECNGTLRCQGLSAIDVGTCGPPKAANAACALATDTLATFTRQPLDRAHPECAGYCRVRQCKDATPEHAACKADPECGTGRCEKGMCTKARVPALGEPCTSVCAGDERCSDGVCARPKTEGSACTRDTECRGECVREGDAATGVCAKRCPRTRPLRK